MALRSILSNFRQNRSYPRDFSAVWSFWSFFVRSFVRSFVRPFVLAFDRNGGARFGGARGRAGPHRFDQMQNESIFFDFWRRAAHRRQISKKMRNENFAFFSIFGGVLRTAAKNRKKCETKTFEVGLKLKFRSWRWFLSNFRQNRSYPRAFLTPSKFAKKFTWECLYLKCLHGYKIETVIY